MPPNHVASLSSAVVYHDAKAALDWLERAFGFDRSLVITTPDGAIAHAEMRHCNGRLMVGGVWADFIASPADLGGKNTQSVHVQIASDIDAHCARAREAGATILQEPENQFYGDRTYRALDLEGHVWNFRETVREVPQSEQEAATGLKWRTRPQGD